VADRLGVLPAYWALLRGQARSQVSYRTSFLVDLVGNVGATVFDVATVLVLFRLTRTLGGFPRAEAMVMVGLSAAAFATADLAVGNIERLRQYVRTGLLDAVLVRPLGALPQLLLMDLPLRKASRALFGVAVLVAAVLTAGIDWTPARVGLVVLAPVCGVVFFASIFVTTAALSFWWIDSGEVGSAFTYGGRDFTTYPVTVYSGWFPCSSPPWPGGSGCATTGAPDHERGPRGRAGDRGARPAQGVRGTGPGRPVPADEAAGDRRRRDRPDRPAWRDGRLHRPQRRREVDHPEDAHRRADALLR
jgi:ABC-2 type transport system permease protein